MCLLPWLAVACIRPNETNGQAASPEGGNAAADEQVMQPGGPKIAPPPSTIGDSKLFPRVFSGSGTTNIFEAWTMKFTLTYDQPFVPVTNDQVPWVNPESYNENNGLFVTYIGKDRKLSLNEPYIQVQYVSRKLQGYSSLDSVFFSLDRFFLYDPGSKVLADRREMLTQSGLVAHIKAYQTPTYQNRTGKFVALAYVPYDKDYYVAFALTTTDQGDFAQYLPGFEKLLASFAFYGG